MHHMNVTKKIVNDTFQVVIRKFLSHAFMMLM